MRSYTLTPLLASIFIVTLMGCKSQTRINPDGSANVSIDLSNSGAPIGYEICEEKSITLSRGLVDLKLRMPERIEIPAEDQQYGTKYIEFHPGPHVVDLYKNLHSARVMHVKGDLAVEAGAPTIRVKLDTSNLTKGKYELGISGDPFFAYCSVDMQ